MKIKLTSVYVDDQEKIPGLCKFEAFDQ